MPTCKDCNNKFAFLELKKGVCQNCINKKTPPCSGCNKNFKVSDLTDGFCSLCYLKELKKRAAQQQEQKKNQEAQAKKQEAQALQDTADKQRKDIILTTETITNLEITERIEIITAECVCGMNVFKDLLFAGVRDVVGGRNRSTQNALKDARKTVLDELKNEAFSLGANGVVGVDLDYSEMSGGGKSMLFVVASGTAVKIKT